MKVILSKKLKENILSMLVVGGFFVSCFIVGFLLNSNPETMSMFMKFLLFTINGAIYVVPFCIGFTFLVWIFIHLTKNISIEK